MMGGFLAIINTRVHPIIVSIKTIQIFQNCDFKNDPKINLYLVFGLRISKFQGI